MSVTPHHAIDDHYDDSTLKAVGSLFLVAAQTEVALSLHLVRLISHPNKIDSVVALALQGAEAKVLLQQIVIVARHRLTGSALTSVITICDKIRDAFDTRNNFAHNIGSRGAGNGRITVRPLKMTAKGDLLREKPYTAAQIRESAIRLFDLTVGLDRALTQAGIPPIR